MAIYMWKEKEILCFTANTANSTIKLKKNGSPTTVTLETSTDGEIRTTYTIDNVITLSNIWDKVYFRNTSTSDTGFSINGNNHYRFVMNWSISASWDITSLINKNCTTTLSWAWNYCFSNLFQWCSALTKSPELPATTLTDNCYYQMFYWCTNLVYAPELPATTLKGYCYFDMFENCVKLETLPKLPAVSLVSYCYNYMFYWCSKIKLSTTQTWEYQTQYRIPTTWTGSTETSQDIKYMFNNTWWTFTWTPSLNTTYYTSNTLV